MKILTEFNSYEGMDRSFRGIEAFGSPGCVDGYCIPDTFHVIGTLGGENVIDSSNTLNTTSGNVGSKERRQYITVSSTLRVRTYSSQGARTGTRYDRVSVSSVPGTLQTAGYTHAASSASQESHSTADEDQ